MVLELIDRGSLHSYLKEHPNIAWDAKYIFALDTARGMAYVHGLRRIHRDLKSPNLLVTSSLRIKVADFGTSAFAKNLNVSGVSIEALPKSLSSNRDSFPKPDPKSRIKDIVGTALWMAPEVIQGIKSPILIWLLPRPPRHAHHY